jgi:hypothetical protein
VKSRRKRKKSKKPKDTNAVPFPDDPFDAALIQAERAPARDSASQASSKKITKKAAMPISTQPMGMAEIIKLQEESKAPINLNI